MPIDPSFKAKLYLKLQNQLPETDEGLGPLNPIYEGAARRLSVHPWIYIALISMAVSLTSWALMGELFLKAAQVLQTGFLP